MRSAAARTARRLAEAEPLPASFYSRATEDVARDLLGAVLECRGPQGVTAGRIVETEAYLGEDDLACHAAAGRTGRTEPLYGAPGIAYVYFVYGMYWCVNAVTREVGQPSAVLIRALEPLAGVELMRRRRPGAKSDVQLTNGPGKLCLALDIDGRHNRHSLQRPPLLIRAGEPVPDNRVARSPRIGVAKAVEPPLRWFVEDNPFVSRAPGHGASRLRARRRLT